MTLSVKIWAKVPLSIVPDRLIEFATDPGIGAMRREKAMAIMTKRSLPKVIIDRQIPKIIKFDSTVKIFSGIRRFVF
jgi:hypothetical protein